MRAHQPKNFWRSLDWPALFYSGIWLIFLLIPGAILISADSFSPLHRGTGLASLALFSLLYLASYGANTLMPGKTQEHRTLRWFLLLLLPALPLGWVLEGAIAYFLPFWVAIWAFQTKPRVGLPVGFGLALLITAGAFLWFPHIIRAGDYGFVIGALFVLIMAWISGVSERRAEELKLMAQNQLTADIARDVHDILGHSLTVINLKAELAQALMEADPKRAAEEMKQVAELSRVSLAEVRATVTRMKSPNLQGELAAAGQALATAGITAHLPNPEQAQVTGNNATLFSWVIREAITNVVRHSTARNCWVAFDAHRVEIVDDGTAPTLTPGNGLTGLASRVQNAGGDLHLSTGTHTRVLATMNGDATPLHPEKTAR